MSKTMTPDQFANQLRRWGVPFEPYKKEWTKHNRNHKGNWGDMHGVMLHHTGPFESERGMLDLLWNGYAALPGPLCHVGNTETGKLRGIGWGRTNHAGLGDDEIHRRVVNENYGRFPTHGEKFQANTDGNACFYGMEVMYSGSKPMSAAQYKSMVLFAAACCDFHDWSEKSCIGHGEWQPGKWDPGHKKGQMMAMDIVRTDIKAALSAGPGKWPKVKPKPVAQKPTPPKVETKPSKPAPKPAASIHIVGSSDTLWSIAEEYLGDGKKWPDIVAENPHMLQNGMKLHIPKT